MKRDYHRFVTRYVDSDRRILERSSGKRLEDAEFRPIVKAVLEDLLDDYDIVDYSKNISWSSAPEIQHQPDLIMVSKSRRRWIVVEVELSHHILGYSYSSPLNRKSDHIYPQVEVFAEGIYEESHIEALAEKLGEEFTSLRKLLLFPPEILVVGDNEEVIRTEEEGLNWKRLEKDFENVHLAFVETFKWRKNHSDSCVTYSGWLPTNKDGNIKIRLTMDEAWPLGLKPIIDKGIPLEDGENQIIVDGISTTWVYKKEYSVIMPNDSFSQEWVKVQVDIGSKIFEISVSDSLEIKVVK